MQTNRPASRTFVSSLFTLGLALSCPGMAGAAESKTGPAPAPAPQAASKPRPPAPAQTSAQTPADLKRQEQLRTLVGTDYASVQEAVRAAMAGPHRKEGRMWRDYYRHPLQTLAFFGLKPNMTVLELWPGSGWYTEILAPVLYKNGKLKVTNGDPKGAQNTEENSYAQRYATFLAAVPEVYGKVETVTIDPPGKLDLGPEGSVDMVLTFRNLHNWQDAGYLDTLVQNAFKVLKKGGVFGVVEHRAKPTAKPEESAKSGYMPESWVIKKFEAAGFKLAGKSPVNNNPKDTKDYKEGVWTLPPAFALGATDREKYVAIGESDRMTLKFVKP